MISYLSRIAYLSRIHVLSIWPDTDQSSQGLFRKWIFALIDKVLLIFIREFSLFDKLIIRWFFVVKSFIRSKLKHEWFAKRLLCDDLVFGRISRFFSFHQIQPLIVNKYSLSIFHPLDQVWTPLRGSLRQQFWAHLRHTSSRVHDGLHVEIVLILMLWRVHIWRGHTWLYRFRRFWRRHHRQNF